MQQSCPPSPQFPLSNFWFHSSSGDGFAKRSGIHVQLEVSQLVGRLARDVELVLFRVVQESLTNIRRHSGSPQAKLRLNRNSHLILEISDLGRGFSGTKQTGERRRGSKLVLEFPTRRSE